MQERYITVSVERRSIEEARTFFIRVENDLSVNLKRLSSNLYGMGNAERLTALHDFFRIGEEGGYTFDFDTLARRGQDFKDGICPDSLQFHSNYFELGDSKVGRVLFLKEYPSYLEDGFLKELTDLSRNLVISIDIQPVPTDAALKQVQNQALAVETDITRWQNKQNQNNNFSAIPPMQLTDARNNMREFLDDLTTRDQRMTLCVMTLVHVADTKEQLDADTDTIKSIAGGRNCDLSVLTYQQEDGLNTALPYGLRKIDTLRTLTTESAAALVPFSSQEIRHRHGVYYGVNATSHNLIVCDRKSLMNGGGFIVGVSGSMLCNTVCCHTRQFIRNGMWIERRSNEVMILGGAAARADCPAIYIGGTMSILEQRQRAKEATQEVLACRDILYTVPETANLLRVNKNMVYDLINCGYLRSIKLGSRKISRNAILEFVEQFDGKTVELPGVKAE